MGTTKMSASFFVFILVVFIQGNSEAAPRRDYDGVPSGVLKPISGAVPVSVPRRRLDTPNKILKAIRNRLDKSYVNELDSSLRDDILQDALAPKKCIDKYGIRDGAMKHMLRGIRDIGGVVIKDFEALGQGVLKDLPLVPNVFNGVGGAITYVFCGVEDALSDLVSGALDEGTDILTKVVVDVLDIDASAPLANIPAGIMNITKLAGKVATEIAEDIVHGVEYGVEDLAAEVASGVKDVVHDVEGVVSGVETDVTNVVHAVGGAVQRIGGGVASGVGNIVGGLKSGIGGVLDAL